jgi:xylulokinase
VRGGFVNLGLTTNRADMARAVLEGVAMNASWLLPHFSALAGHEHHEVTLGGGGAASALWGQILADCLGVPVRRLANSSTTNAHGAALLALSESGCLSLDDVPSFLSTAQLHAPSDASPERYRRLIDAFVDFHERTAPFYASLNEPKDIPS